MNWKFNPKTGRMEPTISPSKEIEKAVIPMREEPKWSGLNTVFHDAWLKGLPINEPKIN